MNNEHLEAPHVSVSNTEKEYTQEFYDYLVEEDRNTSTQSSHYMNHTNHTLMSSTVGSHSKEKHKEKEKESRKRQEKQQNKSRDSDSSKARKKERDIEKGCNRNRDKSYNTWRPQQNDTERVRESVAMMEKLQHTPDLETDVSEEPINTDANLSSP